ncbi:ABC transporter related [Catenulispora acidiphila DSM 44928]|uniref:ABC transporter related n=1 Tax=Catenulispora acidiphila (strain DSM 44928 / JCM 14897 / NBRC 102108 / NRRL B-24433 / ID139908) TaxID=479433 RepID=C7QD92_CATAD|nr:ABC transporter ATP-binding protein [Catenulispora acidiphila]ACU72685.1 ABC transporter related [Catenulispora acidiphila DSM 44928]
MTAALVSSEKTAPSGGEPPDARWLRRLAGYCLRHRTDLVAAYGAALVAAIATAVLPLVLRHIVDGVDDRSLRMTPWLLVLAGLGLLRFAGSFLRRYCSGRLSLGVQYDLRNDALAALLRLGGGYQDELRTGQVVSRSISDITLIQQLLQMLPNMTGNFLMFFVSLVFMAVLSPVLTLVALVVAPALYAIARHSRKDLFPANWHAQQEAAEVATGVEEAVTGVRVVKGFGQEEREIRELETRARRLFSSRVRVARLTSRYNPALQAVPPLGQVAVLALGGWLALRGDITLGTFLAFTTYLSSFVNPVRQVATLLTVWQQARAGVERVLDIVDVTPGIADRPDAADLPDVPLALEWDGVVYGHGEQGGRPLLNGFSLRVEPGETLALVGAAGSGKSTAAYLIPRFYDPGEGSVRIGGVDVRDLRLASLRSRLGFVFEDSHLVAGTIGANIAFAEPDAPIERIRAAARVARADEFIDTLPDGYDTVVGEQGLTLSGGQRQRIALARAILRDPAVLILDDATSAIDARVEKEIHAGLHGVTQQRTTLIIAHRASTLELADRIAVLDGGRVVDIGTAAELQERSAVYRALLSGEPAPGELDIDAAEAAGPYRPGGITEALWQRPADDAEAGEAVGLRVAQAFAARAAGAGHGGGRGALGGGVLGSAPPTPQMLAHLEQVPLIDQDPDIRSDQARSADPHFGLASLIRPFRGALLLGLILVALDAAAEIAVPVLVRHGVDSGIARGSERALLLVSLVAAAIVLADWIAGVCQVRVTGRTGERLLYTLRVKTFAQLQRLGLDYYEREQAGRIMTRMTTDVDSLSNFLQTGLATLVVSVLTVFGVLIALLVINAGLALVLVAALPVLAAATAVFRRRSVPAYLDAREKVSAVNADLQENVTLIRVTQAFGREAYNHRAFAVRAWAFRDSRLYAQRLMATFFPFVEFLSVVASAAVLFVGARQVRSGALTAGTLIAFLLCVDLFFSPIQQLSQVFDGYQQAVVGLGRLRALMRTPSATPASPDPVTASELAGEIEFDDVGFGYRTEADGAEPREVLHGISFRIAAGETVALVGTTGAGKSTIVKLVARFYDPTSGAVRVDGVDVRDYDLGRFRHRLGIVPQESHISGGTVRDAIAYGRPDATDTAVEAAARAVGAHEMVAGLPHGYRTDVGERGRTLSAGQRQLLALARAELVDPDILLLDEATASLDLATERRVALATAALTRRRTTIVVAHRLTTAMAADRIVVLGHGRVLEAGPHSELLQADGPYARLWQAFQSTGPTADIDVLSQAQSSQAESSPAQSSQAQGENR